MTWLRCVECGTVVGWLEDNTPIVEGKVVRLSYKEKEKLKQLTSSLLVVGTNTIQSQRIFLLPKVYSDFNLEM